MVNLLIPCQTSPDNIVYVTVYIDDGPGRINLLLSLSNGKPWNSKKVTSWILELKFVLDTDV